MLNNVFKRKYKHFCIIFQLVFHVVALFLFGIALHVYNSSLKESNKAFDKYGLVLKSFGVWTEIIHIFYCLVSITKNVLLLLHSEKNFIITLWVLKDFIQVSFCFPMACFSGCLFLVMKLSPQEDVSRLAIQGWRIGLIYVAPFCFQTVETLAGPRRNPKFIWGCMSLVAVLIGYFGWFLVVKINTGQMVYRIIEHLDGTRKAIVYVLCLVTNIFFFILGRYVNSGLWGPMESYKVCPCFPERFNRRLMDTIKRHTHFFLRNHGSAKSESTVASPKEDRRSVA